MKVYIRHAEKAYNNGKSYYYKHDPPLTDKGRQLCKNKAVELIKTGFPSKILCSPYQRCRETAEQLQTEIYNLNPSLRGSVPIFIDPNLSEYLGNHPDDVLDVLPETQKFNVPHPENWINFIERISTHNRLIQDTTNEIIWIVTHGVVLGTVCRLNKLPFKKKYDYLENIII